VGVYGSPLLGFVDVTRAMRNAAGVDAVLTAIAGAVSKALGFETVVLNVYRAEWDDFYVAAVHGSADVRDALLGSAYEWDTWEPLLHPRFRRGGAYFIPNGSFDWSESPGDRFVPPGEPVVDGPHGWHPADELFVPLERADGHIVGIMSFGHPVDGLRPSEEKLAVAAALATHATIALEMAEERARLDGHRRGLEELLRVSSQLPQTVSTEAMLSSVCRAIRDALGFEKVMVQLVDAETKHLCHVASYGWEDGDAAVCVPLELEQVQRLFEPEFEVAGCYLVPGVEAGKRVDRSQVVYESELNGKGPHAWNHHWLMVPLFAADGTVRGVIWADEPSSRLLPSENTLQALRIFGNHAMEALAVATQLAETRFLADHDPLTRLLNRRALLRELADASGAPRRLALVFLDLDNFKEINDEHGHATGDRVLEQFADCLVDLLRSGDDAFRVGGDEFALLLVGAGETEAREVVGRIVAALASNRDPLLRRLAASFGIATTRFGRDPHELIRIADEAMYDAKRAGTQVEVAA
jgi:diguanylate cyclase (GGDEF)-like protein